MCDVVARDISRGGANHSEISLVYRASGPSKEPLMISKLLPHPWHTVGADLFQLKDTTYLLVTDYFSRYPEICKFTSTTSPATIQAMKAIFSGHGIPHTLCSNNGPQFDLAKFRSFSNGYNFTHTISSPRYPQSNGCLSCCVMNS